MCVWTSMTLCCCWGGSSEVSSPQWHSSCWRQFRHCQQGGPVGPPDAGESQRINHIEGRKTATEAKFNPLHNRTCMEPDPQIFRGHWFQSCEKSMQWTFKTVCGNLPHAPHSPLGVLYFLFHGKKLLVINEREGVRGKGEAISHVFYSKVTYGCAEWCLFSWRAGTEGIEDDLFHFMFLSQICLSSI